ncbi:MAG: GIY-YIG nuclease family protein [Cytophagales bacterium]|nr:MAG: GIY-YIG nuclease family protein [Cytophagales bacterium]
MNQYKFYVYMTTNPQRTVLYTGMTNDLVRRMEEHSQNRDNLETFAGKYHCHNLVYWEFYQYVNRAIAREKEIKGWRREKKIELINSFNPEWRFLNNEIQD